MREVIFGAVPEDLDPVLLAGNVEHVQEVGQVLRLRLRLQRARVFLNWKTKRELDRMDVKT